MQSIELSTAAYIFFALAQVGTWGYIIRLYKIKRPLLLLCLSLFNVGLALGIIVCKLTEGGMPYATYMAIFYGIVNPGVQSLFIREAQAVRADLKNKNR